MSYLVIDLETTVKNTSTQSDVVVGDFAANPHHPANYTVVLGYKFTDFSSAATTHIKDIPAGLDWSTSRWDHSSSETSLKFVVGQNIAFDIMYMYKQNEHFRKLMETTRIWDIQIAEYILTGQQEQYASLQDMIVKYGGELKPDWPKEQWDKGIQTEDMDPKKLREYCENDVEQTENIFLHQYQQAIDNEQLDLILMLNEAKLATIEMEYNGIYVNTNQLALQHIDLNNQLITLTSELLDELILIHGVPRDLLASSAGSFLNSDKVLSTILFGGTYKVRTLVDILDEEGNTQVYKSGLKKGKTKTRWERVEHINKGIFNETTAKEVSKKLKTGNWQINEQVIRSLLVIGKEHRINTFRNLLEKYLEYTDKEKTLSTYVKPFLAHAWEDGLIHPTFNHANTNTGRLSSSKPNFQNITNKG